MNRTSFRTGLSLAIAAILVIGIGAFATLSYLRVKQAVLDATFVRLRGGAQVFAQLAVRGLQDRAAAVTAVAADPAIQEAVRTGEPSPAALAALGRLGPDTGLTQSVELRDSTGRRILGLERTAEPRLGGQPETFGVSPLFKVGETAGFEITAPVELAGHRGYVAVVRTISFTANSASRLADLVGPDGQLLLGNSDGSVWTDLKSFIERPPPSLTGRGYARAGRDRLSVSAPIQGAPFVFAVEVPREEALAPIRDLVRGFVSIGAVALLVGLALAWVIGRKIVRPVVELTESAERIASGDLSVGPVVGDRNDEIGRLARTFTVMADSVRRSRDHLEEQVAARTGELAAALARLQTAQNDLVRNERLAALGLLSGGVGHELRNPLGVMSNALYYLELAQPDAPEKIREYHGIIRNQIRASEKIVSDLLDFARARTPERAPVPIAPFVDEQLERVAIPSSITVEREVDGNLPAPEVDREQVGQVMVNLLTNAVQAMQGRNGKLTVRAVSDNGAVKVQVVDTGPGVPEDNLDRIFEPLYTTKARGIGLGLSISRILARSNGGELTVSSLPGHGATFTLELPVDRAK